MTNVIPLKSIKLSNAIVGVGEFNDKDTISNSYLEHNSFTLNGIEYELGQSYDLLPVEFYKADIDTFGIVKLSNDIKSKSDELAATANSVNQVYTLSQNASNLITGVVTTSLLQKANTIQEGIVMLYDNMDSTSTDKAATANVINAISTAKLNVSGGEITGNLVIKGDLSCAKLTSEKILTAKSGVVTESTIDVSKISNHLEAYHTTSTTISVEGNYNLDSINPNTSADYCIEANQSGNIQIRKILLLGNNDTCVIQEYAQANTNGDLFGLSSQFKEGKCILDISVANFSPASIKMTKS